MSMVYCTTADGDQGSAMSSLLITVEPGISGVERDHPARQSAAADLEANLRDARYLLRGPLRPPLTGEKGWAHELGLSLGSAGAVAGVVQVIHLWFKRDRRRSIEIVTQLDDTVVNRVTVTGDTVSEAVLLEALRRAIPNEELDA
ncbi:effector-associated constant component EACC1 [Dactylosporangium sp. CS-033363]|uniref:effector-associated constant component EACC1 n=1 Tax=Dactylosporangium sp. CS-033363 TaxID=3239935 RepID=UPI003D9280B9